MKGSHVGYVKMKTFEITYIEETKHVYEVSAETKEEAEKLVQEVYIDGEEHKQVLHIETDSVGNDLIESKEV